MNESTHRLLKFQTASELLARPEPKLEWLIENIWVDKSRGLIAGNPGVGKTWLALDMLISVASGQLCLGKYPVKQGPVLLMEEEASDHNLQRRVHSMARARGLSGAQLASMHFANRQFTKLPADFLQIGEFIIEHKISLVVFDSLRRFHNVNENSSSEMQEILDCFGRLNSVAGASVALIHHLSKASETNTKPLFERLRGSSDLWAWRDCVLGVEGEEESEVCSVSFQFRDAEAQAPLQVVRSVDDISGAITLTAKSFEETTEFAEKADLILQYMQTQFGSVPKEKIYKAIKGRKQDFVKAFRMLEKQRIVQKNGLGWTIKHAVPN